MPAADPTPSPDARPSDNPAVDVAVAAAATLEAVDDEPVPTYRTLIPPAATLHYQFRRGPATGSGDLHWQPAADGYDLTLDIRAGGPAPVLSQTSRGGFDAAGLAPLRFTDRRLRRPTSAANFQRDAGRITFSGPSTAYPLLPGSQDRLSALLQLTAIVAAEPALRASGARVVLRVVGAHGDAAVWVFVRQEPGSDGPADPLAYRREPRGPYDLGIAVWLDPARGYLPSQLVWRSAGNDDAFELRAMQDGALRP